MRIPHLEYMREAGAEGIEMVMWLIMRGALDDKVERGLPLLHVPASNTAVGHIILENKARAPHQAAVRGARRPRRRRRRTRKAAAKSGAPPRNGKTVTC